MSRSRRALASPNRPIGRCATLCARISTCRAEKSRRRSGNPRKKNGPCYGAVSRNRVRRELLVPIDGAPKVQANPELEEVEHAREQKARIARDYRLLRENRQLARLNLHTADRDNRTAATLALDFVEERVRWESVGAVYENAGIAQYGDRISETSVRRDAAKMFGESETGEGNAAHVVDANRALPAVGRLIEEFEIALKDGLVARYVEAAFCPGDHPIDTEIDRRSVAVARYRESVNPGFETPEP